MRRIINTIRTARYQKRFIQTFTADDIAKTTINLIAMGEPPKTAHKRALRIINEHNDIDHSFINKPDYFTYKNPNVYVFVDDGIYISTVFIAGCYLTQMPLEYFVICEMIIITVYGAKILTKRFDDIEIAKSKIKDRNQLAESIKTTGTIEPITTTE